MSDRPPALGRYTLAVFCVALAVQGLCIAWLRPAWQRTGWANFAIEDAWTYAGMADVFRRHGFWYDGEEIPAAVRERTPGYPLLIWAAGALADGLRWPAGAVLTLTNAVLYAAAAALLVRLIAAWTTAAAGLAAGLIFTVTPAVPFSLAHMPESLASVLWIGSQLLLLRGLHRPSVAALGLAGVAGAAATLTKPVFLYYEAVALVVILAGWQGGLGRRLAAGLIHAGLYALTLAPWYARNWAVWHTLVLTPLGGTHLYQHMRPVLLRELGLPVHDAGQRLNGGFADDRVPQTAEEWQRQFNSPWHNLARRSEVLGRLAAEDLVHYRAAYLRLVLRRHAFLYLGTAPKSMALLAGDAAEAPGFTRMSNANTWAWAVATGWWKYQVLSWGVLGFTYLAGAVGVCRAWRQRRWAFLGWGLLTLGYFAAITMPFNHSRYRFPMMPVFAGLAGCGMAGAGGGLGGPRAESVRAKSAGVRE